MEALLTKTLAVAFFGDFWKANPAVPQVHRQLTERKCEYLLVLVRRADLQPEIKFLASSALTN